MPRFIPYRIRSGNTASIWKLDKGKTFSQLAGLFEQTTFWSGRRQFWAEDILKALFRELERKDTGYKIQAEAYMKLLLISLIRKYKQNHPDKRASTPPSISSRASLIIEESFLYGYQTLTLETLSERLGLSQRADRTSASGALREKFSAEEKGGTYGRFRNFSHRHNEKHHGDIASAWIFHNGALFGGIPHLVWH